MMRKNFKPRHHTAQDEHPDAYYKNRIGKKNVIGMEEDFRRYRPGQPDKKTPIQEDKANPQFFSRY